MRVVVTGLVATYPVGGVAWDYLQYVQGFQALGCEVVTVDGRPLGKVAEISTPEPTT